MHYGGWNSIYTCYTYTLYIVSLTIKLSNLKFIINMYNILIMKIKHFCHSIFPKLADFLLFIHYQPRHQPCSFRDLLIHLDLKKSDAAALYTLRPSDSLTCSSINSA